MKFLLAIGLTIPFVLSGCGSPPAQADDKDLRAKLTAPVTDPDTIPPAQRAQVLALMKSHGAGAKAAELEAHWGMKK